LTQQRHVICQQILELQMGDEASAFKLQNQISALYRNQIVPLIEAYCNQLSEPEVIHRIDSLCVDIGDISLENLENDFVEQVSTQLLAALVEQLGQPQPQPPEGSSEAQPSQASHSTQPAGRDRIRHGLTAQPVSPIDAALERLQMFILSGQLPWWSEPLTLADLEAQFRQLQTDAPLQLQQILQRGLAQRSAIQRMAYQFSATMRKESLNLLVPHCQPAVLAYLEDMQALFPRVDSWRRLTWSQFSQYLWQGLLLQMSLHKNSTPSAAHLIQGSLLYAVDQTTAGRGDLPKLAEAATNLLSSGYEFKSKLPEFLDRYSLGENGHLPLQIEDMQNGFSVKQPIPVPSVQPVDTDIAYEGEIYVQNAGLVLLWPFLNRFFATLELVQADQFISSEWAHRGVLLLQYLVTGSGESLESELSLNKLLCGLDLLTPTPARIFLTEIEIQECERLLTTVLHHWKALNNTSIEGVRQAFLQRPGILQHQNGTWRLRVEQKTYDVLLDQLPWSIGAIKLPWVTNVMYVEW